MDYGIDISKLSRNLKIFNLEIGENDEDDWKKSINGMYKS